MVTNTKPHFFPQTKNVTSRPLSTLSPKHRIERGNTTHARQPLRWERLCVVPGASHTTLAPLGRQLALALLDLGDPCFFLPRRLSLGSLPSLLSQPTASLASLWKGFFIPPKPSPDERHSTEDKINPSEKRVRLACTRERFEQTPYFLADTWHFMYPLFFLHRTNTTRYETNPCSSCACVIVSVVSRVARYAGGSRTAPTFTITLAADLV